MPVALLVDTEVRPWRKMVCLAIRVRKEGCWKRGRCGGGEEHQVCDAFHDQPRCSRTNTCPLNQAARPSFYFANYHNHSHEWNVLFHIRCILVRHESFVRETNVRKMDFKIFFFFFCFLRDYIETRKKMLRANIDSELTISSAYYIRPTDDSKRVVTVKNDTHQKFIYDN